MTRPFPPLGVPRPIRALDGAAISRIAAGEVVERPASAVKELVENALDAGAARIDVAIAEGGRGLIRVADDGHGIPAADLPLALARHATSKTDGADLLALHTFGFRGEALAALGAVARLTVTSRVEGQGAHAIGAEGGQGTPLRPAALSGGTVVEVRDLFFATPARQKFLKGDRAEAQAVVDAVRRLALTQPFVAFCLRDLSGGEDRLLLRVEAEAAPLAAGPAEALALARRARAGRLMGPGFARDAVAVDAVRDGMRLSGLAGLPAAARGAAVAQHLAVNGRPVRDRLLQGALRAAYGDLLARGRHPAAALFLDLAPEMVDVNVHPAKSEVRFREPDLVRGLVVAGLRAALLGVGARGAATLGAAVIEAFRPEEFRAEEAGAEAPRAPAQGFAEPLAAFPPAARPVPPAPSAAHPLGAARAQLHGLWILAETEGGLVLVDQHAAHERLLYERLKREAEAGPVPSQPLLVPEVVELAPSEALRLLAEAEALAALGLVIEPFGGGAVLVRAAPAALPRLDAAALLRDLLDGLEEGDAPGAALTARRDARLSRVACHGSVRAGRALRPEEMDALLREMERTPGAGTCNHGRPTFVELRRADVERLFGRR